MTQVPQAPRPLSTNELYQYWKKEYFSASNQVDKDYAAGYLNYYTDQINKKTIKPIRQSRPYYRYSTFKNESKVFWPMLTFQYIIMGLVIALFWVGFLSIIWVGGATVTDWIGNWIFITFLKSL